MIAPRKDMSTQIELTLQAQMNLFLFLFCIPFRAVNLLDDDTHNQLFSTPSSLETALQILPEVPPTSLLGVSQSSQLENQIVIAVLSCFCLLVS